MRAIPNLDGIAHVEWRRFRPVDPDDSSRAVGDDHVDLGADRRDQRDLERRVAGDRRDRQGRQTIEQDWPVRGHIVGGASEGGCDDQPIAGIDVQELPGEIELDVEHRSATSDHHVIHKPAERLAISLTGPMERNVNRRFLADDAVTGENAAKGAAPVGLLDHGKEADAAEVHPEDRHPRIAARRA